MDEPIQLDPELMESISDAGGTSYGEFDPTTEFVEVDTPSAWTSGSATATATTDVPSMTGLVKGEFLGENPPAACEALYNQYTNNGVDFQNVLAAPSVQKVLDKCIHTGNKPRCATEYDNIMAKMKEGGIELASHSEFPPDLRKQLLDCRDNTTMKDGFDNLISNRYGLLNDAGTAIWDGSKWISGRGLDVGTAVAGKAWNGAKWIGAAGLTKAFEFGKIVKNYIWDGSKWVAGTARNVGTVLGTYIWDGTKWVSGQTVQVGTTIAGYAWDGVKWGVKKTADAVVAGAVFVDDQLGLSASALRWVVYMFIMVQVLVEIFGTASDLFGINTSIATRMTVMGVTVIQIMFAGGLMYLNKSAIDIGMLMGALYFGSVLLGSVVSGMLNWSKMQAKSEETSKIFDIIGLFIKAGQAVTCVVFGMMFFVNRDVITETSSLHMYAILSIAGLELIQQMLKMVGLT